MTQWINKAITAQYKLLSEAHNYILLSLSRLMETETRKRVLVPSNKTRLRKCLFLR